MEAENKLEDLASAAELAVVEARSDFAGEQQLKKLEQLVRSEISLRFELYTLQETMQQMAGQYLSTLAKGESLLSDRLRFRIQTAENIQEYRYKDMAFRIFRNEALQKYRAQFDMAAMYVYLAAKAYDYETAFLDSYTEAGQHYLTNIVRQRTIGTIDDGVPLPGNGLAGVLAELKQNFDMLKGNDGIQQSPN